MANALLWASQGASSSTNPVILTQPASQTVGVGNTASFRVTAVGAKPLAYQWRHAGAPVSVGTTSALTLANVQTNDAGPYDVVIANSYGSVTSAVAVLTSVVLPPSADFQIGTLLTSNSRVVDHDSITGDDRGGIAVSSNKVLYSGDYSSARFALSDLSGGAALGVIYDAMVSDIQSGTIYSLGNGSTPIGTAGGTVTTLLQHDGNSGLLNGSSITLSSSIYVPANSGNVGIFAGYGKVVLHTGSHVYAINLPSGLVSDLGAMSSPSHTYSESWAYWGVAESWAGQTYLVYVRDYQTIVRTRVPDGVTTTVNSFSNLSDMASFTVSPLVGRWYFHYEGSSQFGGTSETIGYADATFNIVLACSNCPTILRQPTNLTVFAGSSASFDVLAGGAAPLSYQWQWFATNLAGATTSALTLNPVAATQAGPYRVLVANTYGMVTSSVATLAVLSALDHFSWSVISSPQITGVPFPITIAARDLSNGFETNFSGVVTLKASGAATNRMFSGISGGSSAAGTYTWGFPFTPAVDLTATHVRHLFGSKVSIWTRTGVLLSSQPVAVTNGSWTETALAAPVPLAAGSNYVVAAYVTNGTYYWVNSTNGAFSDGLIGTSVFSSLDAFPTNTDSGSWPLVGLRYTLTGSAPVTLTPTNTTPFVNGIWTGNLTIWQPGTNLLLLADDGASHTGVSLPFDVVRGMKFADVWQDQAGQIHLSISGLPGDMYRVLASTNLLDWQLLGTVTNLNGMATFIDTTASNFNLRFYRLVSP